MCRGRTSSRWCGAEAWRRGRQFRCRPRRLTYRHLEPPVPMTTSRTSSALNGQKVDKALTPELVPPTTKHPKHFNEERYLQNNLQFPEMYRTDNE
ncbi:hypothetical protein AVEN_89501-1 [Araneus ventricosus]|uniref:Uncharacterized protein n=1 Tax=Araneus ventricosus TaxID=182803 RepID=A0A4Y2FDL8_ARAVE|nr:hypothetical protein AVEN_226987-1 [Araneus ventricosus]GBM38375.1 hypothetical protein AVEN_242243-1 [Araneus ventricosus]GBM38471.1 hypothetical protein AVEN_51478-1 [Araneus ventricosus]GBM38530.1 hypothetical protein AVEN_89501-1 [Araneus ventricosus]